MIEFALTLPVLLLLAISIFDYGYYLEHVNNIATVVRDGARYASLFWTTTPNPWDSACPAPTATGASGGWSCAGLQTTVSSGSAGQIITQASYSIDVASITGFTTYPDGFTVATTTSGTGGGPALINCSGTTTTGPAFTGCTATSGAGTLVAGASLLGDSNFVEGVIQQEAEGLTVPEGGLPLDNIDCCWSSSSGGSGCPSGSGTTPSLGAAVVIPTAWPSGVTATGSPVSCMAITYWKSSDLSYSTSSLSLCGWWSADASGDAGQFQPNSGCTPAPGEMVQVTVAYAWSQASPGPAFTVLNSVFGINVVTSATYSLVVMN